MEPSAKRRKLEQDEADKLDLDGAGLVEETEDADKALLATPQSFKDAFNKLPEHFRKYLAANGVPNDAYDVPSLSRFVRYDLIRFLQTYSPFAAILSLPNFDDYSLEPIVTEIIFYSPRDENFTPIPLTNMIIF
jgi:dihydrodipicolinate synthase/N-acetylneuraminate lyase